MTDAPIFVSIVNILYLSWSAGILSRFCTSLDKLKLIGGYLLGSTVESYASFRVIVDFSTVLVSDNDILPEESLLWRNLLCERSNREMERKCQLDHCYQL